MPTLEQELARLESIEAAIASGTTDVSYGDKSVKYRSLSELIRIRDELRNVLGVTGTSRRSVAGFDSGLEPGAPSGPYGFRRG
jgi:hypothetical protein